MSPIFAPRSDANKLPLAKGSTLADLIGSTPLADVGRYNWGTSKTDEISRALIELVGCQTVDADPARSELDPLPGAEVHLPVAWKPDESPIAFDKTYQIQLRKQLAMPAVAITELTPWFKPGTGGTSTPCNIKYRLEGLAERADKTDVEVHVARHLDRQGTSQSSYYTIKTVPRRGEGTLVGPDNPNEESEVPCGTDAPTDTHIWKDQKTNVAPGDVALVWDGKSTAKAGILKPNPTAYINSTCAPYSVLIRYYKNDDDKAASLVFKEAFCPRWNVTNTGRVLDTASLKPKWMVTHGPKKKLVHGQLLVFDKNDAVVCRVALNQAAIDQGELDLNGRMAFDRGQMPYRVQIQAHSGLDEPDGLAIAVMPTQVKAYDYKRVQFIAFNVRPPSPYSGNADHDADIAVRCTAMIDAVKAAAAMPSINAASDVLKIFMAPEFYFRGPDGAYPMEKIETIMPKLRVESDKIDYADWMFVFGTAIGYEKREGSTTGSDFVHDVKAQSIKITAQTPTTVTVEPGPTATAMAIPAKDWFLVQGTKRVEITNVHQDTLRAKYVLTFAPATTFAVADAELYPPQLHIIATDAAFGPSSMIRVRGTVCRRIPVLAVGGKRWKVTQGGNTSEITACTQFGTTWDVFELTVSPPLDCRRKRPVSLVEPMSTEVTNVALVQKGYPSPYMGDGSLRHVAIYKENVSPIDFANSGGNWHEADGSLRRIGIHGETNRPVLPTFGSTDLLGASPNTTRAPTEYAGSEINKSGIGGGVVFSMDDVTFGLEVCLDHGKSRLSKFYGAAGNKTAGDPKIQVHLIPAWGSSIGDGEICAPSPAGPVFNVDGSPVISVARINDGTWSCDLHPEQTGGLNGRCTKQRDHYYCSVCRTFVSENPGNCDIHTTVALLRMVKCGRPGYYGCTSGCWGKPTQCAHPGAAPMYACQRCGNWELVGTPCGCGDPDPVAALCGTYYDPTAGNCPKCNGTDTRCNRLFQKLGRRVAPTGGPVDVASAMDPVYFQRGGRVLAYPAVAIPAPAIV